MLFGIEKQRGKASGKDLYSKYEPWENPSNYQGVMRIENDGVTYRIERNFNRQNKSFKVINEDAGVELSSEEIDHLFMGLMRVVIIIRLVLASWEVLQIRN